MRKSICFYVVAVSLAVCSLVGISRAQGAEGDTSISYDDQTGTVTAYGDTLNDLSSDYASQPNLSVKDQNGTTVASSTDFELYDNAATSLQFTATPGSTYTAVTYHCFELEYVTGDSVWPSNPEYYDYYWWAAL